MVAGNNISCQQVCQMYNCTKRDDSSDNVTCVWFNNEWHGYAMVNNSYENCSSYCQTHQCDNQNNNYTGTDGICVFWENKWYGQKSVNGTTVDCAQYCATNQCLQPPPPPNSTCLYWHGLWFGMASTNGADVPCPAVLQ